MFWKRKKTSDRWPEQLPGNPGLATEGEVTLRSGRRERVERFDLLDLLADALEAEGHKPVVRDGCVVLSARRLTLLPLLCEVEALDGGGARSVTTIQFHHPRLVPDGAFEYQHWHGDTFKTAAREGFDLWVKADLVSLLAALDPEPAAMNMVAELPGGRRRRVVFGPVGHYQSDPPPIDLGDEHPFCGCCLFTNCGDTFGRLFDAEGFTGLRLYAAREPDGTPQADCRVNGEDFPAGLKALRKYAATWPAAGFEFRKQYVVVHDLPGGS